jgi:WD40 repeat protein
VVTAGGDGVARVWDAATGRQIAELKRSGKKATGRKKFTAFTDDLVTAVFSPDGRSVVASSLDKKVRIWEVATQRRIDLVGHTNLVSSAAFSPDGTLVATSGFDGSISIWDRITGERITEAQASRSPVWSVAFGPKGRLLTAALEDGVARVYRCEVCGGPRRLVAEVEDRTTRDFTREEIRTYHLRD